MSVSQRSALRAKEICRDNTRALIAIESVDVQWWHTDDTGCAYGALSAVAVVVCHRGGAYALGTDSSVANIDLLRQRIPELDAIMAIWRSQIA